ncbi:MAG: TIGR04255 family protein [Vulcanimicrobiaceae bacterium]
MFAALPEPDRRILAGAPLNIVVFQIEFASVTPWAPNSGLKWRAALKERAFEGKLLGVQQKQISIQMAGGQPQGETSVRAGHQLLWSEGQSAAIYETAMILESRQYTSWGDYRQNLQRFIDAAREVRDPQVLQSTTLRYVNALSHDDALSAEFWTDKVNPAFLGPFVSDALRPYLQKGLYLLSFHDVADLGVELRIGIQPDAVRPGRVAYVFDMEFVRQEQEEFNVSTVLEAADRMNTAALQLFQQVVNEDYRAYLAK